MKAVAEEKENEGAEKYLEEKEEEGEKDSHYYAPNLYVRK